ADFGEATSSEVPDTLTAHKSIQSATTSKDAILEDTCNDKEAPCATTETVSGLDTYVTLVSEGEDDVGTGWDREDLTGEGEPYFGVDEDGPPKPELLFKDELIKAGYNLVGNNQTGRKRRTRVCKVCSLLKNSDDVRGGDSSTYCSDCKLTTSSKRPKAWRVFLCDKARREHNGIPITCFDLWHKVWRNGSMLPNTARKCKIRARTPATPTEGNGDSASSSDRSSEGEESAEEAAVEGSNQPKRPRLAETAD
ncbi:hypothetical protein PC116_g24992, partial [Phytophthora cactorum]